MPDLPDVDPPADTLDTIRAKVAELRNCHLEAEDLEARLTAVKTALKHISQEELPTLMDEAGVRALTIAASGNLPAYEAKLEPHIYANIPVGWDAAKRKDAFDWLDANGHGGLIKTEVTCTFGRDERTEAKQLHDELETKGLQPLMKEAVHTSTLSAWLREEVKAGRSVPLEVIGGYVGRQIKLKDKPNG